MRTRPLNGIEKHRYLELYHRYLQYPKWKEELAGMKDTVQSPRAGKKGTGTESATESLVIRREKLRKRCEMVEQTALQAAPDIYKYLLIGVTTEGATFEYLKALGMPCERTTYYRSRRRFYRIAAEKDL